MHSAARWEGCMHVAALWAVPALGGQVGGPARGRPRFTPRSPSAHNGRRRRSGRTRGIYHGNQGKQKKRSRHQTKPRARPARPGAIASAAPAHTTRRVPPSSSLPTPSRGPTPTGTPRPAPQQVHPGPHSMPCTMAEKKTRSQTIAVAATQAEGKKYKASTVAARAGHRRCRGLRKKGRRPTSNGGAPQHAPQHRKEGGREGERRAGQETPKTTHVPSPLRWPTALPQRPAHPVRSVPPTPRYSRNKIRQTNTRGTAGTWPRRAR